MPLDLALHTSLVRIAADQQAVWKMHIPLQVVSIHNACGSKVSKIHGHAPDFALHTTGKYDIILNLLGTTLPRLW